jgi:hypothetical protein
MFMMIRDRTDVAALTESARRIADNVKTHPPPERDDFGQRISAAVKRITAQRSRPHRRNTATANAEETFAEILARVTKARAKGVSVCRS